MGLPNIMGKTIRFYVVVSQFSHHKALSARIPEKAFSAPPTYFQNELWATIQSWSYHEDLSLQKKKRINWKKNNFFFEKSKTTEKLFNKKNCHGIVGPVNNYSVYGEQLFRVRKSCIFEQTTISVQTCRTAKIFSKNKKKPNISFLSKNKK